MAALANFTYTEAQAESLQSPNLDPLFAQIAADHSDLAAFDVYLAGPEAFVALTQAALARAGVMSERMKATVA
jgi:hypothetical protein